MDANKIRVGHNVMIDGSPCIVLKANLRQQPRLACKMITKLKNLLTGAIVEKIFTGGDNVEEADIHSRKMKYLYNTGSEYIFMDNESFEQYEFSAEKLADLTDLLIDDTDVYAMYYNGTPVNITLPPTVTVKVTETEPGVKGDTATGGLKAAKVETGAVVQVPLFIEEGDYIVVNTETKEYRERAKK